MSAARFPRPKSSDVGTDEPGECVEAVAPQQTDRPPAYGIAGPLIRAIRLRRRIRQADKRIAIGVGTGNVLLCCVLLLVAVGALFVEPTTREQETEAWHLAGRIYGYWLVSGLVLFPVLRMTRTLVVHLATMIVTPAALFVLVVLSAVR